MHPREAALAGPAKDTGQARWSLRLFGRFELSALSGGDKGALPGKRERVLLASLALSPNCRQQRRKLATLLWGDASDETALDNLRTSLWSLRKALGDTEHCAIASDGEDIVLDVSAFEIDAVAFRRLAAQSGRSELEEAANLYSGELLDGLDIENDEFESWRRAEAARAKDQAVDVLLRLMTQLGTCGETEAAIEIGTRLLKLEPLHERAVRRLIRLYGESGRRGPAVQLYRALADALKTELDAQPEAETRAVLAEVCRGGEEPAQALTALAVPAAVDTKTHSINIVGPRVTPGGLPPPAYQLAPVDGAPRQIPPQHATARRPQWILAGGLAAVIAILLLYQFVPWSGRTAEKPTVVAGTISIAVLPFANLSADPEQEFFSDGMTEEIITALAKVPDLRVVARTSAGQFKGEKKDVRAIGQALGATHLIEGSVRKDGNEVRITAQLIQSDDGLNLWSGSYDRDLTDVFAIQEDIAKAIARALRVPLGLKPGERLLANSAIAPKSYEQYLRARAILRNRNLPEMRAKVPDAIKMLEQVVARDPNYAPAWGLLALMSNDRQKKKMAADEAIRLDSRNAAAYTALGGLQAASGNWAAVEDLRRKALSFDPDDPESLDSFSNALAFVGRSKEALSNREKLRFLEPFVPIYNYITATIMIINGQNREAIEILEALPSAAPRNITLAQAYAAEGRYGHAADTLLLATVQDQAYTRQSLEDAAHLLRTAPSKVKAPEALPAIDGQLSFVYLYIGAPERVLDYQERQTRYPLLGASQVRYLWGPEYSSVRKTERFKTFVRKMHFVEYWRARGWPDLCHPVGADDFACE